MSRDSNVSPEALSCDEVAELSGLYVLGALEREDERRVAEHLASCSEPHPEMAQLGSVAPALASLAEPIDAPPELKARVMDAYRRDMSAPATALERESGPATRVWEMPLAPDLPAAAMGRASQLSWQRWAPAALALVLVAALGGWGLSAQARADQEAQRAATMAEALHVLGAPDAEVALLRGSGDAAGASGFAAFSATGNGYVVVSGLPQLPTDLAYQAWYLIDDTAVSAGIMALHPDGFGVLARIPHRAGTDVIALTRERAGGVDAPTSAPVVAGELRPA